MWLTIQKLVLGTSFYSETTSQGEFAIVLPATRARALTFPKSICSIFGGIVRGQITKTTTRLIAFCKITVLNGACIGQHMALEFNYPVDQAQTKSF